MAHGREDDRAPRAARRAHRHTTDAGADNCSAVASAHAARITGPRARTIGMAVADAEPVGRARTGTEPPGVAGTPAVAPRIIRTGAVTQRRTGTPAAALGAADTGAVTHGPARPRGLVESIARDTGMERGARGRPADDRVAEAAVGDDGIARAAAETVGIAVTAAVAYRMAVARAAAQNVAMTRAGANRIAGAGAGAHDVRRTWARDNQGAGLVVIEDEGLAAGVEADAAAGGRVSGAGRTRHLYVDHGNRRRRSRRTPLGGRDGHEGEPDQRGGKRRERGNVLNVRIGHARRTRRRGEGVAHAAAETSGRAGTAHAKRASYPESHANSVSTARREAHRVAAPAAAAKSGAGDAFVKRITRTAPGTDAIERGNRPRAGMTGSRTSPRDIIAERRGVARARASTPGTAEASPSIAMTGAAPDGGARTAEGAAVASTGPQRTALVTSDLDGDAVTAA